MVDAHNLLVSCVKQKGRERKCCEIKGKGGNVVREGEREGKQKVRKPVVFEV